jgi:membrane fusion protein, multidrug efflux system
MSQSIQPPAGRSPRQRRWRSWFSWRSWRTLLGIAIVVVLAIVIGVLLTKCAAGSSQSGGFGGGRNRPTITVGIAKATLGDVPITVSALGTVTPEATVSVISRVTGQINRVNFTEGELVKSGQLLATIDPAPFQAALDQAKGTLAQAEAVLAGAKVDLERYRTLLAQNSVAKQTYDDQVATVRQDTGTVVADKAAVETAQVNLNWTRIASPVTGRVGLRQIDAGNQVSANATTPIAVVTQIDPIDVIFAVPEDSIASIVRHANFGAGLPVTAYDRAGGAALVQGSLATIDNVIDTTTGTVKGKARFPNPNAALFPNQFVNVTVLVDTLKNQVVVPTTAIRHGPQGDFVYVLQTDSTVKVRQVKSGPSTGESTSIASGLAAGETVITEGGDRLRDGAAVTLPKPRSAGASNAAAGAAAGAGVFGGM